MQEVLTVTITEKEVGKRLDKALSLLCPDISRERLKALLADNAVTLNKESASQPAKKVKLGEIYSITIPEAKPLDVKAENIPLDILFEDDHLVIINKSADISVHPANNQNTGTLVNALLYHCKNLSGIGGVERPGIVHRLDKGTSGVMVVAKDDKTHKALTEMFQNRTMDRNYIALCHGVPLPRQGEITTNIGRHPKDRKKMAVVEKNGKEAITKYEVLETFLGGKASLCKFKLMTGRTHQIRVHAHHIGHGILGDPVYGKKKLLGENTVDEILSRISHQMLHAYLLGFTHPITGENLRFETDPPADMAHLISTLKDI